MTQSPSSRIAADYKANSACGKLAQTDCVVDMPSKFFVYRNGQEFPINRPKEVIPFLGRGELHWKKGRSAYEVSNSWIGADGIPEPVQIVLQQSTALKGARLIRAFLEHEVDLRTPGRPSQTDIMALVEASGGQGVLAVEAKVDETFGPIVREWRGSVGKDRRLVHLCKALRISADRANELRYQLLHRTASAIYQAQEWNARHACMIVHSFDTGNAGFTDFKAFAAAIGTEISGVNDMSAPVTFEGIQLQLGWCSDRPRNGSQAP